MVCLQNIDSYLCVVATHASHASHGVRTIIVVLVLFPPVFQPSFNCEPASGSDMEVLSYAATVGQFIVAMVEVTGPGENSSQGGEGWIPTLVETERDKGKLWKIFFW